MAATPTEVRASFSTEINSGTSETLISNVEGWAGEGVKCVRLTVASPGGETDAAMRLYGTLTSMGIELVTHATGEVASMGTMLFLAGGLRLASPEATFLIHPTRLRMVDGQVLTVEAMERERST